MKVIIAEKPSVAREIARVVRATNKKNGYIEGGGYAVTWALGHLITAAMPEAYGIKGFHKENLPILPPVFTLIPRQIKEGKGYKADATARLSCQNGCGSNFLCSKKREQTIQRVGVCTLPKE